MSERRIPADAPAVTSDDTRDRVGTDPDVTRMPLEEEAPPVVRRDTGRYHLGAELARGGMGVVYRAEDSALKREVAVKVLAPDLVGTDAARRFAVEAEITAGLQHPSIPPVHDLGVLPDGRPFLSMKLIKGVTLAKRLAQRSTLMDDRDTLLAAFEQICLAVAFAHSRRVIHRDLKPLNVMVGAFGEVQVMDWGLAKVLGHADVLGEMAGDTPAEEADDRTRAGQVMGTPSYMPPEQARGELDRIDERADVFALGGILCAILTGRPPYTGRSGREVCRKAADANLDEALAALDAVDGAGKYPKLARRCLEPNPKNRYAHAGEVAAAAHDARTRVERARRQEELKEAVDESDRAGWKERWHRRWWQLVGAGGLAFGLFAFFIGGCVRDSDDQAERINRSATFRHEIVPLLIDLAAREADADTFKRGWNGSRRDEVLEKIRRVAGGGKGRDEAILCVLLASVAEIGKDRDEVERQWADAVKRFPALIESTKEALLCLEVIREFGSRPTATLVDRLPLKRAVARLKAAPLGELTNEQAAEIPTAVAKAERLLGVK